MNDLGLTLAWLAVQVALVLGPALVLQALASRRGPAPGAWVAAWSLGLVVALLPSAFLPKGQRGVEETAPRRERVEPTDHSGTMTGRAGDTTSAAEPARVPAGAGLDVDVFRRAWARLERGAAVPAAQCRPWGSVLGALALAGMGAGLLHLAFGLWAVDLCQRRGRAVDDPEMTGLLDGLRGAMGQRRAVALYEVADLTTPATAGWWRPLILLPEDWRSWDDSERRAVLAHELAHVVRGDYAACLVARLALALNSYHPLVRWMAGQLQMEQELAADALGARYAGGRASYLVALSRLALKQDGRSPSWPARAFLPRRGALIRRIRMLRDENQTVANDRSWSKARRLVTALGLFGLTAAVGTLRGPALADEKVDTPTPAANAAAPAPSGPLYLREGKDGVVVFRPAALFRHQGMAALLPFVSEIGGVDLTHLAKDLKVDTARPGFINLDCRDIEWVTVGLGFGRNKDPKNGDMHSIMLGSPVVRTLKPFDWLAFLRQWRLEPEEVRVEKGVYYKLKGPVAALIGPKPSGVYLPDDRTIVLDEEQAIRKLVGEPPATPAYLQNEDWEKASRGLVAVAVKNQNGEFAKHYDLGRPDDALVLSVFKDVERWIFSVDDADAIALNAVAACRGADAGEAVIRAIASLRKLGETALEQTDPKARAGGSEQIEYRMSKAFLENLTVERLGNAVRVHTDRFGTLADYATLATADLREGIQAQKAKQAESVKR